MYVPCHKSACRRAEQHHRATWRDRQTRRKADNDKHIHKYALKFILSNTLVYIVMHIQYTCTQYIRTCICMYVKNRYVVCKQQTSF